jgi:hypothetical protein
MSTEPGNNPIGDFQRWLMRAGARSVSRDVAGRVRSTIGSVGGGANKKSDVWDTATTEVLTEEPPECQWCPICRAARRYRDAGGPPPSFNPQFGGQFGTAMGDTLAGLTRDAFSLFDAAMRPAQRPPAPGPAQPRTASAPGTAQPGPAAPGPGEPQGAPQRAADPWATAQDDGEQAPFGESASDHGAVVVGAGVGWPAVVHPEHQDDEAADERGDGQEGGQPGDGGAGGGTDQQVERPAE